MYETVSDLFTGICDAIREKDGTTALISHQDIPDRIAAISGSGSGELYYIYKSGEEMNGHSMTIHGTISSKKTDGWIYIHLFYRQVLTSDLIQAVGFKRVGMTILANGNNSTNATRFTNFLLRDTSEIYKSGNDWIPVENGNTFLTSNIVLYPDTKMLMSGTVYIDIPDGIEEFYIVIDNVNVDLYIEELWLE